jgi:hypothetical protein
MRGLLRGPVVVDLSNICDPSRMKAAVFGYACVGRKGSAVWPAARRGGWMSVPKRPKPAKLFVSVISAAPGLIARVFVDLAHRYGPIDFVSALLPFAYTDYYHVEMGQPLWRRFASFVQLIQQEDLVRVKEETNDLERRMSDRGMRSVNIDPGYLLPERLVLATGKDGAHRIYLDRGIFADLTLIFRQKEYRPLPWTYPDYGEAKLRGWLGGLRQKYLLQLRNTEQPAPASGEANKEDHCSTA